MRGQFQKHFNQMGMKVPNWTKKYKTIIKKSPKIKYLKTLKFSFLHILKRNTLNKSWGQTNLLKISPPKNQTYHWYNLPTRSQTSSSINYSICGGSVMPDLFPYVFFVCFSLLLWCKFIAEILSNFVYHFVKFS